MSAVPHLEKPIRIVGLEVDKIAIRLQRPLSISFLTLDWQENFYLRLVDESGVVGWGEGAPIKAITGDSLEEALEEASRLRGPDLGEIRELEAFGLDLAKRVVSRTLLAALDFAAHDLLARRLSVPVYQLYGPVPRRLPNSVTVFIQDSPEATGRETRRLLSRHPHAEILKIKLKGSGDVARCAAIAANARPGLRFILDANQGFAEPVEAIDVIAAIGAILGDVVLVEEPCRKGDHEAMACVRDGLRGIKVFADESCVDRNDLEAIISSKCADGINIKLQKTGGISVAKRLASRAAEAGLEVMLGAMFETPLSHSAGAHFAVSTPNVILSDLDMDLDLPNFFHGRMPFESGCRTPLQSPGFAFDLDGARLRQLEREGTVRFEAVVGGSVG